MHSVAVSPFLCFGDMGICEDRPICYSGQNLVLLPYRLRYTFTGLPFILKIPST